MWSWLEKMWSRQWCDHLGDNLTHLLCSGFTLHYPRRRWSRPSRLSGSLQGPFHWCPNRYIEWFVLCVWFSFMRLTSTTSSQDLASFLDVHVFPTWSSMCTLLWLTSHPAVPTYTNWSQKVSNCTEHVFFYWSYKLIMGYTVCTLLFPFISIFPDWSVNLSANLIPFPLCFRFKCS